MISAGSDGHADIYTEILNGVFSPIGRSGWNGLSPYIGGGAGLSYWNSFVNGSSISHSDISFAADAIFGVDYAATSQIAIGARYQFLWTEVSALGAAGAHSDFSGHILTAHATIHF